MKNNSHTPESIEQLGITEDAHIVIDTIASGLKTPFAMDWMPDGSLIFTERGKAEGSISMINVSTGAITHISGVPKVYAKNKVGMMDVLVHPDCKNNGWIYFCYCRSGEDSTSTLVVERARLKNQTMVDRQTLLVLLPYFKSDRQYGSRMKMIDSFLFVSMGDRYYAPDSAQTFTNDFGKIIRILEDGRIPEDNPFYQVKGALREIWSYGHRNPQGLAVNPQTSELWEHEHGPKGGDEINIIHHGKNYGWPVICYGTGYEDETIGNGIFRQEGMEQPVYYYKPSIAPSGMQFYTSDTFPKWKGNLFIGALALRHLNRLVIYDNKVLHEERMLSSQNWRIGVVKQGPDGYLYLGTDNGLIVRLRPDH